MSPRVRPLRLTGGAAGSGGATRALVDWLVGVAAGRAGWVGWCGLGHGRHRLLRMAGKAASGRVGEGDGLVAVRCELAGLWWSSWTSEAGRVQVRPHWLALTVGLVAAVRVAEPATNRFQRQLGGGWLPGRNSRRRVRRGAGLALSVRLPGLVRLGSAAVAWRAPQDRLGGAIRIDWLGGGRQPDAAMHGWLERRWSFGRERGGVRAGAGALWAALTEWCWLCVAGRREKKSAAQRWRVGVAVV